MSDDARLREAEEVLRDALRIEPSPALLARVRADAAAAPPRRGAAWLGAAAAALLLGASGVLLVERPQPSASVVGATTAPSTALAGPASPSFTSPTNAVSLPVVATDLPGPRASATSRPVRPSSEVIVPPGQVEALARLVQMVDDAEIGPPSTLLDPPGVAANLSDPASIEVEPLDIVPIEWSASSSPSSALSPIGRGDY